MIDGSGGGETVKVYKDQGSKYIRCHMLESNIEYIHILQHDGTIGDGIFRQRYADGYSAIGSRYFRRSGREEDRMYCVYRFNASGNIFYGDKIWGRDGSHWKTLVDYSFNQETLEWTDNKV